MCITKLKLEEITVEIESDIRTFIAKNLLYSGDGFRYSDDISFLEEGIVDSIGVMELVAFVEEKYKFRVNDQDVTPDNFDSVNRLASYIRRNLQLTH
jgi:acyl carrier protein